MGDLFSKMVPVSSVHYKIRKFMVGVEYLCW